MRLAVVGHLEWVEFVELAKLPAPGEITYGTPVLAVAAGGGAVAAVAFARWSAESLFFTAFGNDELGRRARDELAGRGVALHAAVRPSPQRRAITFIDAARERTIVVMGERHVAHGADPLPWDALAACDAVYIPLATRSWCGRRGSGVMRDGARAAAAPRGRDPDRRACWQRERRGRALHRR